MHNTIDAIPRMAQEPKGGISARRTNDRLIDNT